MSEGQLIFGVEEGALGVQHLQEIRQPRFEALLREVSRPRTRSYRALQNPQTRVCPIVGHQRSFTFLQRLQNGRVVTRLRLFLTGRGYLDALSHAPDIQERKTHDWSDQQSRIVLLEQAVRCRSEITDARSECYPRQILRTRRTDKERLGRKLTLGAQDVRTTTNQLVRRADV